MQAIILAAGMGRRLGADLPKALIEINGITLLERLTGQLRNEGVEEILVTCGPQRTLVEKEARQLDLKTIFNPDFRTSDNLVSFWSARANVQERCLILHGDVIASDTLIEWLVVAPGDVVLPMDRSSIEPESMKIRLEDGQIQDLSKTIPIEQADGESIPMMVFSRRFLKAVKKVMDQTVADGLVNRLLDDAVLEVIQSGEYAVNVMEATGLKWMEIDTPQDLEKARRLFGIETGEHGDSSRE